jgi:hypothetical protein
MASLPCVCVIGAPRERESDAERGKATAAVSARVERRAASALASRTSRAPLALSRHNTTASDENISHSRLIRVINSTHTHTHTYTQPRLHERTKERSLSLFSLFSKRASPSSTRALKLAAPSIGT